MSESQVRIVKLEPIHVASLHGFGKEPENQAWMKLTAWAKPKGYLDDLQNHRIFGFNNPNPSPGSPNYGYELWMAVGADENPEGEAEIKDFAGGLYAVSRCEVKDDPVKRSRKPGRSWCTGGSTASTARAITSGWKSTCARSMGDGWKRQRGGLCWTCTCRSWGKEFLVEGLSFFSWQSLG